MWTLERNNALYLLFIVGIYFDITLPKREFKENILYFYNALCFEFIVKNTDFMLCAKCWRYIAIAYICGVCEINN